MKKCLCEEGIWEIPEKKFIGVSAVNITVSIVIFGASGDLTKRKLIPAFYNLFKDGFISDNFYITGFARREKAHKEFRAEMKEMWESMYGKNHEDEEKWNKYNEKVFYHRGNFNELKDFEELKKFLLANDKKFQLKSNRIFYLACDPEHFSLIIENLYRGGLLNNPEEDPWTRVVIEKPFGKDLKSARDLHRELKEFIHESQTYRIDHYLGKETVQNILSFRFGNAIFEPIFNSKYVDHIQITVARTPQKLDFSFNFYLQRIFY